LAQAIEKGNKTIEEKYLKLHDPEGKHPLPSRETQIKAITSHHSYEEPTVSTALKPVAPDNKLTGALDIRVARPESASGPTSTESHFKLKGRYMT